ncbi:MAG: MarR family winged helix-turn-helix transcriptional regulator [Christensenellaceae bacterium]
MKRIRETKNWRNLLELVDDGYKGMFVLLRIVQESERSVTAGELAKRMCVTTARIARALNTLEKKEYIRRESDESDARKVVIRLTSLGEEALKERKSAIAEMIEPMFNNLTEAEADALFSLLEKLLK